MAARCTARRAQAQAAVAPCRGSLAAAHAAAPPPQNNPGPREERRQGPPGGGMEEEATRSTGPCAEADAGELTIAQQQDAVTSRRAALGLATGAAALVGKVEASQAAYGEAANVFGSITNTSGFLPYEGDGFTITVPSKWNPSKEREYDGTVLKYEDNFDAVSNLIVQVVKSDKSKVSDYGSQQDFLQKVSYLFGETAGKYETASEGGFQRNTVTAASVLDVFSKEKDGKPYYYYELLIRSADGDEGGRHQLIAATVDKGQLYILKVQSGDKRWFKGAIKECKTAWESFTVA